MHLYIRTGEAAMNGIRAHENAGENQGGVGKGGAAAFLMVFQLRALRGKAFGKGSVCRAIHV